MENPFEILLRRLNEVDRKLDTLLSKPEETPGKDDLPEFLDRKQAAAFLGVTVGSIDKYCQKGILRKKYIGGKPLFERDELRKILKKQ